MKNHQALSFVWDYNLQSLNFHSLLADEYLEGHIKNNDRILLDINDGKPVVKKAEKKKK